MDIMVCMCAIVRSMDTVHMAVQYTGRGRFFWIQELLTYQSLPLTRSVQRVKIVNNRMNVQSS